ncbi:hypothetical protein KFK09_018741 [Dendrobium nobile]|uniref:Uncharacterized protein n=1 Tax=Dendrobium nobile TaxID=94219 RepID=A0A8T3AWL6_DENNO|nr:hypothetical protein KFK09_018741 [Dendrobium nobile]
MRFSVGDALSMTPGRHFGDSREGFRDSPFAQGRNWSSGFVNRKASLSAGSLRGLTGFVNRKGQGLPFSFTSLRSRLVSLQ